jgi:ribosome maturation factor RimP
LTELLVPVVADLGLECLGVEYSPSHGNSLVRVYIDAPGRAVTVDDCEAASRQISATLDVNDPIQGRYTLEVSSPGLDRPLRHEADYRRFAGRLAKIVTAEPIERQSAFAGRIAAIDDGAVILEEGRRTHRVPLDKIKRAHLDVEF